MATEKGGHHQREPAFGERLEERARRVVNTSTKRHDRSSVASLVEDEIALTLDHLDSVRKRWKDMERDLLDAECEMDTELMQMEQRTPRYSPYRFPEREKLKRRLMVIAQERRRLVVSFGQKVDECRERLLSLLHKHEQLTG